MHLASHLDSQLKEVKISLGQDALRSCTVGAIESSWPFTSDSTNHIYWAVLELE